MWSSARSSVPREFQESIKDKKFPIFHGNLQRLIDRSKKVSTKLMDIFFPHNFCLVLRILAWRSTFVEKIPAIHNIISLLSTI